MRYLFVAPPATGEMQPALAIAFALLREDVDGQIYIASGSSFHGRFEGFVAGLSAAAATRIFRLDLGDTDDVEDYSKNMLRRDSNRLPALFGTHRHSRGNPVPFFNYWQAFAAGNEAQRLATVQRILRIIDRIRPDMVVVDQIYGTPFDAVRYSRLPFVVLAPGHPSFAADANPIREPLSMSGIEWKNSLWNILDNFRLLYKLITWVAGSPWAWTTLKLRRWTLGFRWLSFSADSMITPPPGKVDEVCAAIMCNVANLNFYKHWPAKCHFVGPCFPADTGSLDAGTDLGTRRWLEDARQDGSDVIFISFGSMFPFTQEDYSSMLRALEIVKRDCPSSRVLWKVVKCEGVESEELPYVRQVGWLPSIEQVYRHPSMKVVVHHGGGNTANEVIYHGLRHLVIPQWSDTYDWAATIASFGLGEQAENEGPALNSSEIARKLLKLLQYPQNYRDNIAYWSKQSKLSSGAKGAACVIKQAAVDQAVRYKEAYSINQRFMATFASEI